MNPWVPIILGVISAAISGFVVYIIARRQSSGQIDTSDAADLWKEGKDMRDALIAQIGRLEVVVTLLQTKIAALEGKLDAALDALRKAGE